MTPKELETLNIPYWPDNDGGFWYWDEEGRTRKVNEDGGEKE